MENWIAYIPEGLIVTGLLSAFIVAWVFMARRRRKRKSVCSCPCTGCPFGESCHAREE